MKLDGTHELNCFVDADFLGGFTHKISHEKALVLSRSGYVVNYSGCPI